MASRTRRLTLAYAVAFEARFKRRLKKKTPAQQEAVYECIDRVAENPRGNQGGLQTKLIQVSPERVFYARVDQANRVSFHLEGTIIIFRNHCFKQDVLRNP